MLLAGWAADCSERLKVQRSCPRFTAASDIGSIWHRAAVLLPVVPGRIPCCSEGNVVVLIAQEAAPAQCCRVPIAAIVRTRPTVYGMFICALHGLKASLLSACERLSVKQTAMTQSKYGNTGRAMLSVDQTELACYAFQTFVSPELQLINIDRFVRQTLQSYRWPRLCPSWQSPTTPR